MEMIIRGMPQMSSLMERSGCAGGQLRLLMIRTMWLRIVSGFHDSIAFQPSSLTCHSILDNARGNQGREARTLSPTYGLKVCNNWIKSILMKRFVRRRPGVTDYDPESRSARPNGRVLDMGCGKGGDIEKWNRLRIEEYVGIGKSCAQRSCTLPLSLTMNSLI
jgi:hypothetical protein